LDLQFNGNANDESGNNMHGIVRGAVLTEDRYGEPNSAYYFNGSDTCMIIIPNDPLLDFYDSLSICLWYKYDLNNGPQKERATIFNKGGNSETDYWGLRRDDFGEFAFYSSPYSKFTAYFGQDWHNLEDGNWHWVGITVHPKGNTRFVDGNSTGGSSSRDDYFLPSNDSALTIGNVKNLAMRGFKGSIDEVKFYNRKLANWEILRLYDDPTNVNEQASEINTSYQLSQNYPNPFNPSTVIKYSIPKNEKSETKNVKLIIYDILGKEIATLVNKKQSPGNYQVEFDGSNLPSGVYFYRLQVNTPGRAGNFLETKKMILLR